MQERSSVIDDLYRLVANEEDARTCRDIPDQACHEVPRNFFLILASLVLSKLGDILVNPKTTLAWTMGALGAPAFLTAWLVPIRESGSLIPQLAIGAWVRGFPRRRGFWVAGSLAQGLCVLAMLLVAAYGHGVGAGLALIGLLVLFSLARGFCSVAAKDVQGKCVPKGRRGRLSGLATTISGIATVLLVITLIFTGDTSQSSLYLWLLGLAGVLWLAAGGLFSRVDEIPGETGGGSNALNKALQSLSLVRDDRHFRHFVITRALLLCSALAAPFLVIMAQSGSHSFRLLGGFLLANAVAGTISAGVWGWMADASSRQVLVRGASIASAVALVVGTCQLLIPQLVGGAWFYIGAFFILSVAHAGVRLGRKTYLVDMSGGNKRTDYVSVSNTVIGLLLLVTGGISALASLISPGVVVLLLGLMGAAGVFSATRLPEVE